MRNKRKDKIVNKLKITKNKIILAIAFVLLLALFAFIILNESKKEKTSITGMAVSSFVDCPQDPSNLVINGNMECEDQDRPGMPYGWYGFRNDSEHIFAWVDDPEGTRGKVLMTENKVGGRGDNDWINWQQTIYNVKPGAWYEFSVDFAMYDIEPILNETTQEIDSWTNAAGVSLKIVNKTNSEINDYWERAQFWVMGAELTDWDENAWIYRTCKPRNQSWKTYTKRFKTPGNADKAGVMSYNLPKGRLYFDNVILKEVQEPQSNFKKSGTLNFIKYKGQDFFPLIYMSIPIKNSTDYTPLSEMKENGFNTAGFNGASGIAYRRGGKELGKPELQQMYSDNNMALIVGLAMLVYKENDPLRPFWVNDPSHSANYAGAEATRIIINNYANFANLLAFEGEDEATCHPTKRTGNFLPDLKSFQTIKSYVNDNASGKLLIYNFCGVPYPYTGVSQDLVDYYFPITDAVTYTQNLPIAYSNDKEVRELGVGGKLARLTLDNSNKYFLAFGLGELEWSTWDGGNPNFYRPNVYVPFNLQRFQIWNQIINRAVGVSIYGFSESRINLENSYDNYHFQQITTISKELASLYPILLEQQFYDEWQISDERVEIMMKKHNGKIYLLTASTHYEDLQNIRITLRENISSVVALNDILDGNIDSPVNRTITAISGNSFTDNFIGDSSSSPARVATPGYAVHIYEIVLGNRTSPPEQNQTCQEIGYYCLASVNCSSSDRRDYNCTSGVCCSKLPNNTLIVQQDKTCAKQGGKICNSTQYCTGAIGSASDGDCCLGECVAGGGITECKAKGGSCKETCLTNETQLEYYCNAGVCCGEEEKPKSNWFYWFVGGIGALIIGIVSYLIYDMNKKRNYLFC